MGTGTEIDEFAVLIKGDGLTGGDVAEAANFVGILAALGWAMLDRKDGYELKKS